MYKPVEKFPQFEVLEKKILAFWDETKAFDKLREKNANAPIWSFLDGPITANNPMGVHHAWGRSLKDMYQRYHAMCGKRLRYQNGYDCQGLWVEVEVEKELGFKSKKDIETYGVAKFVAACKARVQKFSAVQTAQSIRLGYWMDWNDSYYTMSETNNYTIWAFLKKAHQRGFIYKDFDSMPWCPRCGVGLSQMEMHEGYKWVEHLSVFVRFPIRGRQNEAFLVWTTTPWTLTSNVAVAVSPDMTYYKVKQGDWTYYVGAKNWEAERAIEVEEETAKGKKRIVKKLPSIPAHFKSHGPFEIVGEVSGRELVGLPYDGPFDELEAQHERGGFPYPNPAAPEQTGTSCHRVVGWGLVTGTEGSGFVHIAPGCGKEDFDLGKQERLVSISPLDETGVFLPKFGRPTRWPGTWWPTSRRRACCWPTRTTPTATPTAGAARRRCSTAWWTSGTSTWSGAGRSWTPSARSAGSPTTASSWRWTG
jgi:isoleucyl-tRNA synthetase